MKTIRMHQPDATQFTERQRELAKELIAMGLTHGTIVSVVLGKDAAALSVADNKGGKTMLLKLRKELGYGVMDARRAMTPFMAQAVRAAARNNHIRVRIA
jgi:hypothetical protein